MTNARMSGEKRERAQKEAVANVLLGVLAVVVSALLVWAFSIPAEWYGQNATERSHNYARQAEQEIAADCNIGTQSDPVDCRRKAVEAARENQRKEQDLAAQKITALWTWVMGAAAVVGVILSAFGVFLVWRTFHATRETNEIARDTAYRDLKAYLSVAPMKVLFEQGVAGHPLTAIWNVSISNYGRTPALLKGVEITLELHGKPHRQHLSTTVFGHGNTIGPMSPISRDLCVEIPRGYCRVDEGRGTIGGVFILTVRFSWTDYRGRYSGEDLEYRVAINAPEGFAGWRMDFEPAGSVEPNRSFETM